METLFSGDKSTVRRGEPSFFGVKTILCSHLVGVFGGTGSITPIATSASNASFTGPCQCSGTAAGTWIATGLAAGSTSRCNGGPVMLGRV